MKAFLEAFCIMALLACTHMQERLDPKLRAIKSEELEGLKKQLGDTKQKDLEKKYAKRYHHVRKGCRTIT